MNRILHISPSSFPALYVDHPTKKIWKELAKGFNSYHILARSNDNMYHHYIEENIHLHLVPNLYRARSFILTSTYMIFLFNRYKFDVVLSQCPILGGFLATFLSRWSKIPIMIELHGMEYFRILKSKKFLDRITSRLMRYSLNNCSTIRSLSISMSNMLRSFGIQNQIVIIPNRVNFKLFSPPKSEYELQNPIRIISVGRFVWEKSYHLAIEAISNLHSKYEIELILIGGGPLLEDFQKQAKNKSYIKIYEWLDQKEIVDLLRESDIYVQTSISEGMPRTIVEAMAIGIPIISTNVGAIPGILTDMDNSILINPNSLSELEMAIEKLINSDGLRRYIAKNAYIQAKENYSWEETFTLYISVIQGLSFNC